LRYKSTLGGAAVGAMIGGPAGLMIGAKAALLAAIGGSIIGRFMMNLINYVIIMH